MSEGLFDAPGEAAPADAPEFTMGGAAGRLAPLAVRMRPASLDEVVGQGHCSGRGRRCGG